MDELKRYQEIMDERKQGKTNDEQWKQKVKEDNEEQEEEEVKDICFEEKEIPRRGIPKKLSVKGKEGPCGMFEILFVFLSSTCARWNLIIPINICLKNELYVRTALLLGLIIIIMCHAN